MHRSVPTTWRLACIVVILVALCSVGTLRAQPPSFPLSAPANPWTAEPVEVKAVLLLLPWEREGRFHKGDDELATLILRHFQSAAIRELGVHSKGDPWRHLYSMRHHDGEVGIPVNPEHIETLIKFYGATHVLSGRLEVDELKKEWTYHARFYGPGMSDVIERKFTEEEGALFRFAMNVAAWMAFHMRDVLPIQGVAKVRWPLYPIEFTGPDNPAFRDLFSHRGTERFLELISANPDMHMLALRRAERLYKEVHLETMVELAKDPLPADAHPMQRVIRATILEDLDARAALHEWEILAAQYPGVQEYAHKIRWFSVSIDSKPEDSIRRMERWHSRAPDAPENDVTLAMKIHAAARRLRGSGWAHTIPDEHLRRIDVYSGRAIELMMSVKEECGPLPINSQWIMDPLALLGQPELMTQIFKETVALYPYHGSLYVAYQAYLAPRWYGSNEHLIAFMNQTMDRYPNWNYPAFLPLYRLWPEASLSASRYGDLDEPGIIHEWLKTRPEWRAVLRKAMEHALGSDMTEESASYAFVYAHHLRDEDTMIRIFKEYPELNLYMHLSSLSWLTHEVQYKPMAKYNFELVFRPINLI
jgi:hypothetical protein